MRKNRPKNYLKLGILLFGISFLLTNCEKEAIQNHLTNYYPELQISKISLNEFRDNERVHEKIDGLFGNTKNGNLQNRTVYDAEQDFYIDTDNLILIELNDYHWLTFTITRNVEVEGLENLVLKYNIDSDTYAAYFVHYAFSEEDMELLENSEYVSLVDKATFLPLEGFDNSQLSDVLSRTIYESPLGYCYELVEETSQGTGWTILVEHEVPCPDAGGGTDNSDNSGDGSNPYGDNNTDSDPDNDYNEGDGSQSGTGHGTNNGGEEGTNLPDDLDDIVITLPNTVVKNKECNKLANISNSPTYQQRIQELLDNTTGNTEIMYYGKTYANGNTIYGDNDRHEGIIDVVGVNAPFPPAKVDSFIHNHFNNGNGTLSVFSGSDLYTVYQLYLADKIDDLSNFVMVVVTPGNNITSTDDDTLYAITINNKTEFTAFAALYLHDPIIADAYFALNGIDANISNSLNEERLSKLLTKNKLGMTLFRGDRNNLNSWTKLKIRNDNTLNETNCN